MASNGLKPEAIDAFTALTDRIDRLGDRLEAAYRRCHYNDAELPALAGDLLALLMTNRVDAESPYVGEVLAQGALWQIKSTAQFRPIGAHERGEMIFGSPATVIGWLHRLNELAGINNLICWMNFGGMPQAMVLRSMELFAKEVIPATR